MKKRVENKGFTLIELLVTVAILGILAAILVPNYVQYIGSTKAKVCEVNRLQFVHSFKVYKVYDGGNYSLADAVNGSVSALSAEKAGLKCPSGGTITASGNTISCSLHGDLTVDMDDVGGGDGGGGTPGGALKPGDKILKDTVILGDWEGDTNRIKNLTDNSNGGNLPVQKGNVYTYKGKTYLVRWANPYLSQADAKEFQDNPGRFEFLYEFDPQNIVPASNRNPENGQWTPRLAPKTIVQVNGDYYLYMDTISREWYDLPPNGYWIKIV